MIKIQLNDMSYEQDVRELLMAFYPGETFEYDGAEKEEAGFGDGAKPAFAVEKKAAGENASGAAVEIRAEGKKAAKEVTPKFAVEGIVSEDRR